VRAEALLGAAFMAIVAGTPSGAHEAAPPAPSAANFGDDIAFLQAHTDIVRLAGKQGDMQVAVAPAWQGRVVTSTAEGLSGQSFGWINRKLIASRQVLPHFNPLGGEDRLWLGPEGGQFSLYFGEGARFDLDHWYVPKAFDTEPFEVVERAADHIRLRSHFELTNYSGTRFQVGIGRTVRLLDRAAVWRALSLRSSQKVALVGYESVNTLTNEGRESWNKQTGLLSIWVLGQFNPSSSAVIVIPIKPGADAALGEKVTSDYFGQIPSDRLKVTDSAVFLRADGGLRSKVGINPRRALARLGSYDVVHHVLTLVFFDQPSGTTEYVNSLWKIQSDPFAGDAANAYNDGPPAPGMAPMGPFYELESSSPAAALRPGEALSHTHRTFHFSGPADELDRIARSVLGVSIAEIQVGLASP
jgi:uncharacterized protein DUF6786